jgi:hypothetical protein
MFLLLERPDNQEWCQVFNFSVLKYIHECIAKIQNPINSNA